jgi:hypothetical protein
MSAEIIDFRTARLQTTQDFVKRALAVARKEYEIDEAIKRLEEAREAYYRVHGRPVRSYK